ncbi:hypothetical protein GQ600_24103 [Phytophthora cactorum]|nr:hypothetical protein GQ600_24103 [Phytophthora cactorum]
MNTCEVQDVASLRPADHISIWDTSRWPFRYTHHGIVFTAGGSGDISIAHSQADSKFQLTSLTEFLNGRPLPDMRRVQYNSSLVAEASSFLGEVHRTHADAPPVVLARCRFLLGLGVGWSKQLLSRTETKVPFLTASTKSAQALEQVAKQRNKKLEDLTGKRVYLQLKDTGKFAKRFGEKLYLVQDDPSEKDWAFRQRPTALRLGVRVQAYNCVRVEFEDYEKPGNVLYASSSGLKLTRRRKMQFKRWFQFELGWDGELQSLHSRWIVASVYLERQSGNFQIVDADDMDAQSPVIEPSSSDSEDSSYPTAPVIKRAESAPELEHLNDNEDGDSS